MDLKEALTIIGSECNSHPYCVGCPIKSKCTLWIRVSVCMVGMCKNIISLLEEEYSDTDKYDNLKAAFKVFMDECFAHDDCDECALKNKCSGSFDSNGRLNFNNVCNKVN